MRIVASSNGKKTVKISKSEWQQIGKTAGWLNKLSMALVQDLDPKSVIIFNRDWQGVFDIINSFGSKRFRMGYIKKDGSYREFEAQRYVNYYKHSPSQGGIPEGLILVVDLEEAERIVRENNVTKKEITNEDGTIDNDKAAYRESLIRKAQRRIYPDKVEFLKMGNKTWVVSDPQSENVRSLLEKAKALQNTNIQQNTINPEVEDETENEIKTIAKSNKLNQK